MGAKAEREHQWRRGWLRDTAHQRLRGTSQCEHPQALPLRARMTRTRSLILSCTFHPYSHLAQVWVSPFFTLIHIVIHVCGLLALTFSFYFPLFLPSLFLHLFLFLTNKKPMANLHNSAKECVDTTDVLSFTTRFLAYREEGVPRIMRLVDFVADCAPGQCPVARLLFGWVGLDFRFSRYLLDPFCTFFWLCLKDGVTVVFVELCGRTGFWGGPT